MGPEVMPSELVGLEVLHSRVWITDSAMMISLLVVAPNRQG